MIKPLHRIGILIIVRKYYTIRNIETACFVLTSKACNLQSERNTKYYLLITGFKLVLYYIINYSAAHIVWTPDANPHSLLKLNARLSKFHWLLLLIKKYLVIRLTLSCHYCISIIMRWFYCTMKIIYVLCRHHIYGNNNGSIIRLEKNCFLYLILLS